MRRTESSHKDSSMKLVSVVIPFFNATKFIRETIESVFAQTYDHWELLLVDDGSTDESTQIAISYAQRYPSKVHYLEHEKHKNQGTAASRNFGVQHAKGEYVAFLDSDDVSLPEKLRQQIEILNANPKVSMVYGPVQFWFGWTDRLEDAAKDFILDLNIAGKKIYEPPKLLLLFLQDVTPVPIPSSVMMRLDSFERIGGFEEDFTSAFQLYEDSAFAAKVLLKESAFVSGKCWVKYRQHSNSCTTIWARRGAYHPEKPHFARQFFLDWLERFFYGQDVKNVELWRALRRQLQPYRYSNFHILSRKIRHIKKSLIWSFRKLLIYFRIHKRNFFRGNTGQITASPNPIQIEMGNRTVCGVTTLSWTSTGTKIVEVRIGAPNGRLFSRSGPTGSATTGRWVRDGMVFYLQDASDGKSLNFANTLAAVMVNCISGVKALPL